MRGRLTIAICEMWLERWIRSCWRQRLGILERITNFLFRRWTFSNPGIFQPYVYLNLLNLIAISPASWNKWQKCTVAATSPEVMVLSVKQARKVGKNNRLNKYKDKHASAADLRSFLGLLLFSLARRARYQKSAGRGGSHVCLVSCACDLLHCSTMRDVHAHLGQRRR